MNPSRTDRATLPIIEPPTLARAADARRQPGQGAARGMRWLACGLACAVWFGAAAAHAQTSASDKAAAEALFDEGLRLLRDGRNAEACAKLEQSQSIDQGIGTMLYLADCYERIGRVASAWALFREASSLAEQAGQSERAAVAVERAEALEPRLPRLTVDVSQDAAVAGLEVRRGGKVVPSALWGVAVPVDPGEQIIEALAPGYELHRASVLVNEGQTTARATIAPLTRAAAPAPAVAAAPYDPSLRAAEPAQSADPAERSKRVRTSGWVLGSVGVAGLAAAGIMGGLALQKDKRADKRCSGSICNTQGGLNAARDAERYAHVSTGLWVAGGVLAATGLTLLIVSSDDGETHTDVALGASPAFAGLHVTGGF